MKNDYYVYIYLDPTNPGNFIYDDLKFTFEPFYVGKGKGNRIFQGFRDPNNNKLKKSKILEIRKYGIEPIAIKIYDNISETLAYELEKITIKKIGLRKNNGNLVNATKGARKHNIESNIYRYKYNINLFVNVIGTYSNFYYLDDGSYINKEIFLMSFEKIR